jgi:hypothetical protein
MTDAWNPGPKPAPEDLMAFADGELDAARREEVAAWLAAHPEGQAEVEDFHRLAGAWQRVTPAEPSAEQWAATLARVEARVAPAGPRPAGYQRRPVWTFAGLAAAAVLGVVMLSRFLGSGTEDEPFPVAEAHEINIVHMDARDADALVGHPPLLGNMVFADNNDVHLVSAVPHGGDGRVARMEQGPVPMIVVGPGADPDDR